jgi:hypothetical protein
MSQYVNAYGQTINPFQTPSALAPKKKAPPVAKLTGIDYEDEMLLGFAVEGWRPEELEVARFNREREIEAYAANPIGKQPQPFDAEKWFASIRPKKVRSKPYDIKTAAEDCAALATKAGWLRVQVTEIRRQRKG